MLKKNKMMIVLSSIAILLPIVYGLIMWDSLPDTIATHWNAAGQADGYSSKAFAVFGFPLILFVFQVLAIVLTAKDKKNKDQSGKVLRMVLWICPLLSWFMSFFVYSQALGKEISIGTWMSAFFSLLFLIAGNYLPKVKHNRTIGIRIKWTLENEENWNLTHRLAGKLWVVCGVLQLLAGFILPETTVFVALMILTAIAVIVPTLYSWRLSKSQTNEA